MEMPRVHIIGMGAATPIGKSIWASAAAARAGVCGFSEHPFMIDTAGEPMCIARAPWLDVDTVGIQRFRELLFPAIDESLEILNERALGSQFQMDLHLSLPPPRPGQPESLALDIQNSVKSRYEGKIINVTSFPVGHAGGYLALEAGIKKIIRNSIDACIVAGVDSYLNPETLEWIEACDQLHGGGVLNNAWGFIPGEASGALFLTSEAYVEKYGFESLSQVLKVGIGWETKLIKTDDVCIGDGLTQAFHNAFESLSAGLQVHNIFCDLNGETYRANEHGFAALRCKDNFLDATDFVAPADCWGDIGAASAPLHIAQGIICHLKRYGKGPLSMAWASSDSGERGAAIIQAFEILKFK